MTAYTKSTNFATKDTLTSGDPLKIVKGTEINTEFDNIQTAVNSKSDTASPTFTGTVTIPTASVSSTTDSSSVSTGSIITAGGVGVAKALYVGTTANVAGAVTLQSALSVTGVTTVQAGTAAAPTITATGDTNTGIFFPAADTIAFTEGGAEAMRIDSSGNVGIGTTSPATYSAYTKLSVLNGVALAVDATNGGVVVGASTSGTELAYLSMGRNYNLANAGEIALATTTAKSILFGTNATERMRIDSSGNLLVGSTSIVAASKLGVAFAASSFNGFGLNDTSATSGAGYVYFQSNGTTIGTIARVGATSAVAYNTTSDARLKSNVEDASPVLDRLMDVKVRQYDWTEGNVHQDYGFIAQELESLLSGIVTKGKTEEDIWQLDYSRLTPHLVKAIQEQQALITTLTERITALENK